jgi:predicted metal-binding protein
MDEKYVAVAGFVICGTSSTYRVMMIVKAVTHEDTMMGDAIARQQGAKPEDSGRTKIPIQGLLAASRG